MQKVISPSLGLTSPPTISTNSSIRNYVPKLGVRDRQRLAAQWLANEWDMTPDRLARYFQDLVHRTLLEVDPIPDPVHEMMQEFTKLSKTLDADPL